MAQYIPKSALVAEIERKYETNIIGAHSAFKNGKIEALREVKDFLDTLEVKDMSMPALDNGNMSIERWKETLDTADLENELCWLQDNFSDTSTEYKILADAIEFIRNTHPQSHWRPSEEQLDTLLLVRGYMLNHYSEDLAEKLSILYKQLKAL